MKNKFQQKGFTLIELLVVIVILGILSTISVGTFRSYFAKARDSERVSTVQNIAMMIKVDSGGKGDCTVYNYAMLGDASGESCDTQILTTGLSDLLADNDYSMPEVKNGLAYYYAIHMGTTSGDNDFFVVVGAEEENPQNGKLITSTPEAYVFLDGTTKGITAAMQGETVEGSGNVLGGCTWRGSGPDCEGAWKLYKITPSGVLGPYTNPAI